MTDELQQMLDAAYAVRWVLVVIACLVMGAIIALLVGDRAFLEGENADLEHENADLRALLEANRPRIVALPPRQETQR